jgi:hypothetical protein
MSQRGKALADVEAKLHLMKVVELRAIANAHGIPIARKKDALVKNIMETVNAGGLWIPGLEQDVGFGPTGLETQPPTRPGEYSVRVGRIMAAKAEGREL